MWGVCGACECTEVGTVDWSVQPPLRGWEQQWNTDLAQDNNSCCTPTYQHPSNLSPTPTPSLSRPSSPRGRINHSPSGLSFSGEIEQNERQHSFPRKIKTLSSSEFWDSSKVPWWYQRKYNWMDKGFLKLTKEFQTKVLIHSAGILGIIFE